MSLSLPNWNRMVDATPLVAFRIIFGALGCFGAIRFIAKGWVEQLYIQPNFHFKYIGFEWVDPLTGSWMYLPFVLMIISSIGIVFGAFYRLNAVIYFLSFTYVELLDKANYLNHYYFVSIVAFLMIWIPAQRRLSIDAFLFPKIASKTVPYWTLWILRFQLTLVYFFAGWAKINSEWLLDAQPLKIWLQAYRDLPLVGTIFASAWLAYFFAWFGCIYDLTIAFFLMGKTTRKWAYLTVIAFHLLTWMLFPIGVFPWVMMGITLVFFPSNVHEKWIGWIERKLHFSVLSIRKSYRMPVGLKMMLIVFIGFQIVFPLRYLLYPGDLFWNEDGYRFSWRVMLMEKKGYASFYIIDPTTGGSIFVDNSRYLNDTQIDQMSRQPDMILEYAHFLYDEFNDSTFLINGKTYTLKHPEVKAEIWVTLNGRNHRAFVTKKRNLLTIDKNALASSWICPEY